MTDTEKKVIEDLLCALASKEEGLDFCINSVEKCSIKDSEIYERTEFIENLQNLKSDVQKYILELEDKVEPSGRLYYFKKPDCSEISFDGLGKVLGEYVAEFSILVANKKRILSIVESLKEELSKEEK